MDTEYKTNNVVNGRDANMKENATSVINTADVSIKIEHVKYDDPSEITHTIM